MALDGSTSISAFLDAAGGRQPTPGGGAVAALSGALGASMGEMVLNYSVGKKGLEHFQSELKPALERFHKARKMLEQLMVEDQAAFEAVSAIRKLPEETEGKQEQWKAAVLTSAQVPAAIAATAVGVLELCDHMVNFVNPMLLSDLAIAAELSMAAVRGGNYSVRINLPDLDAGERGKLEGEMAAVSERAQRVIERVVTRIWDRVELEKK